MRKIYLLFLVVIFSFFSCKSEPKKAKGADDPGLSQIEMTTEKEKTEPQAGFSDEITGDEPQPDEAPSDVSSADKDALAQDGVTDGSVAAEPPEVEEKPSVVEAVQETKEPPKTENKNPATEEKKPAAPAAKPAQPPVAVIKEDPSKTQPAAEEKPAEDKQDAKEDAPPPPPPHRPPLTPPPTVTAVQDDAPIPNRQALVPPKEEEIIFSRIVNAMVGQLIEIPFRGTGWVYMGEISSRKGLAYNSRRFDVEGQSIIFMAEEAGNYGLKFFKHDVIRDYILNDYVQVIVSESPNKNGSTGLFNPPLDRGKVTAEPRWPSALEEEAMLRGGARPRPTGAQSASAAPQTGTPQTAVPQSSLPQGTSGAPQTTAPQTSFPQGGSAPPQVAPQASPQTTTPPQAAPQSQTAIQAPPAEKQEKLSPEEILKKAQDAFNGGKAAEAIALLDQYMEYYPGGDDELYWLYGQFYEANTPSRNILLSLDYYRRLVDEYPQSRRYNDARRRISYLERFYINIQ